jgi:hypothetical protein
MPFRIIIAAPIRIMEITGTMTMAAMAPPGSDELAGLELPLMTSPPPPPPPPPEDGAEHAGSQSAYVPKSDADAILRVLLCIVQLGETHAFTDQSLSAHAL